MKLNWNFLGGEGEPSMGGVWIFSGTAYSVLDGYAMLMRPNKVKTAVRGCYCVRYWPYDEAVWCDHCCQMVFSSAFL